MVIEWSDAKNMIIVHLKLVKSRIMLMYALGNVVIVDD